jgi:hypothetical protein
MTEGLRFRTEVSKYVSKSYTCHNIVTDSTYRFLFKVLFQKIFHSIIGDDFQNA